MAPRVAPYGTWDSPITADAIAQSANSVAEIFVDPVTSTVYHVESRPSEGGRCAIVKTEGGVDLVGKEFNCRTGVHEYGGAAAAAYSGTVFFSNFADGRVYAVKDGSAPTPVTPESKVLRYANFAVHPKFPYVLVCVCEDHTHPEPSAVSTSLVTINTMTHSTEPLDAVASLVAGADFYASPTFSPDGTRLAWQQWNHPDMPWTGSEIYVASIALEGGRVQIKDKVLVAGRAKEVCAAFPAWVSDHTLLYTSDVSGWHNPWTYDLRTQKTSAVLPQPIPEDFAMPQWALGMSFGATLGNFSTAGVTEHVHVQGSTGEAQVVLYSAIRAGRAVLYLLSLHSGTLEELECPYVTVEYVRRVTADSVVFLGAKTDAGRKVILCTLKEYSKPKFTPLGTQDSSKEAWKALFSPPQSLVLTIPETGEPLHIMFHPPTNPEYVGPEGEKPPCVVSVHGGPTGMADQALDLTAQYFTSRGFAWVDVNYSGSSGYGRQYIDRLAGQWGIADVRDCALTVQQLAAAPHSLIDAARTAIRGRSSGGYSVLQTLCMYPTAFAAGTSHFGISDLRKLDEFTHKFESRYCEGLLGGTPAECGDVYDARSPIHNADKIQSPLLVLQGSEDAVVPPEQAELIVKSIRDRGGKVEYIVFEGEGHGWRKAENVKRSLEEELHFYEGVFGLKRAA
ncbi:alpha/beta hydrolase [Phanerochaete sordida]|uniref:Alpha/beta hydrolase n=1 Tax=Phanerochaete sordida TaxID=48140 RepID=A0A9P3GEV8_9APHY|nr:alpha/beta hydrolase [Phanerochaete sordida]